MYTTYTHMQNDMLSPSCLLRLLVHVFVILSLWPSCLMHQETHSLSLLPWTVIKVYKNSFTLHTETQIHYTTLWKSYMNITNIYFNVCSLAIVFTILPCSGSRHYKQIMDLLCHLPHFKVGIRSIRKSIIYIRIGLMQWIYLLASDFKLINIPNSFFIVGRFDGSWAKKCSACIVIIHI